MCWLQFPKILKLVEIELYLRKDVQIPSYTQRRLQHWFLSSFADHSRYKCGSSFYIFNDIANHENFVSSPASILVLLSLLFSSKGANGNTKTQICQAITGQSGECDDVMAKKIDEKLRKITTAVDKAKDANRSSVVKISNAAFVQKDFEVLKSFWHAFSQDGANKIEKVNWGFE